MTRPVRRNFNQRIAQNQDRARIRNLERSVPRPSGWAYATPVDPAPTPDDYGTTGDDQPFQNGWQNIALPDGSWSPLRWRINHAGRAEVVGAIDGGALGSVCVTLPSLYRPQQDVLATVSSTDGSRVMTVKIDASTGEVTVVGIPAASATVGDGQVGTAQLADGSVTDAKLTDSGVGAGTYGDASHVAVVTVNAKGRVTGAVSTAIAIAEAAVTGLVADLASKVAKSLFGAKGDILVATAASTPTNLAVGPDGDVLTADAAQPTGVKWAAPTGGGGGSSPLTTKGDLYTRTASADAREPVGADNTVLVADAAQTTGIKWVKVGEAMIALADVTTDDVSSAMHGFAPKSPADATKFLNGAATPAYAKVKDTDLSVSDVLTNNVGVGAHGFAPKAPNDPTQYLDGTGAYSVPGATAGDVQLLYAYTVAGSSKASIDTDVDGSYAGLISGSYAILEVYLIIQSTKAAAIDNAQIVLNNDTGANYDNQFVEGVSAAASAGRLGAANNIQFQIHAATGTSGYASLISLFVPAYASTTFFKVIQGFAHVNDATAGNNQALLSACGYRSTSAVNRLKIAAAGGNLAIGSQLLIYGRK